MTSLTVACAAGVLVSHLAGEDIVPAALALAGLATASALNRYAMDRALPPRDPGAAV